MAAADTQFSRTASSSNMSGLVRCLATANPRESGPAPKTDGLPNPNDEREESNAAVCAAANE